MKWLWTALTLVSLSLCIAAATMWARSYRSIDSWNWDGKTSVYDLRAIRCGYGELQYARERTAYPSVLIPFRHGFSSRRIGPALPAWSSRAMAANVVTLWPVRVERAGTYWFSASIPLWPIVSLTSLLPLARAMSILRREHRRHDGRCPSCGYDLRATPNRCPECGYAASA